MTRGRKKGRCYWKNVWIEEVGVVIYRQLLVLWFAKVCGSLKPDFSAGKVQRCWIMRRDVTIFHALIVSVKVRCIYA